MVARRNVACGQISRIQIPLRALNLLISHPGFEPHSLPYICAVLPVLELDRLGIAHPRMNSDVVEWQTHLRDIFLIDHERLLQMEANTSHKYSQTRYNILTLPHDIRRE